MIMQAFSRLCIAVFLLVIATLMPSLSARGQDDQGGTLTVSIK